MYSFTTGLFVLCCTTVYAGVLNEAHLNFKVKAKSEETSERIDINYRDNYVQISTPAHQQAQAAVMLHDYNQGINVLKRNGDCFLLDEFDGVPDDIKDWEQLSGVVGGESVGLEQEEIFRNYQFRVLRFFVDRSTLPESVQRICPGPIRIVILEDILEHEENADVEPVEGEDTEYSEIFLPGRIVAQTPRVKRQWILDDFRTGETSDGRHTIQTRPNSDGYFGGIEGRWDGSIKTSPIGVNFGRERDNFRWEVGGGSDLSGNPYARVGISFRW